jgi:hypothetical protein
MYALCMRAKNITAPSRLKIQLASSPSHSRKLLWMCQWCATRQLAYTLHDVLRKKHSVALFFIGLVTVVNELNNMHIRGMERLALQISEDMNKFVSVGRNEQKGPAEQPDSRTGIS